MTIKSIAEVICENLNISIQDLFLLSMIAAFFKIVVAQSCFKQPLSAPARVSRAAPDLASRHR